MAWENFDAEMRKRLSRDFDAGFNQSNGQTNLNYYQNNSDWKAVGNALGLGINSMNDLNAVFDYVGTNKKKKAKEVSTFSGGASTGSGNSGASYSTATAFDPGRAYVPGVPGKPAVAAIEGKAAVPGRVGRPGVPGVAAKNPLSLQGMSTAARGPTSWMGAGSFDNNPGNWGMRDLMGAYNAGYTEQDVENFLRQGNKFLPSGAAYQALREAKRGISTKFLNPDLHGDWKTWGDNPQGPLWKFGHADLIGNRKAGHSDQEILDWLDKNLNRLNPAQRPGVPGGIYEQLNSKRYVPGTDPIEEILPIAPEAAIQAVAAIPAVEAIDPIEAIPARNLLIGNSTLGNAGYAQAVAPNRSESSRSNRSSYGTSQYNRTNFGKKKRSGITTNGLNI